MEGPSSARRISLLDVTPPELIWIVGYRAEMVGEDGRRAVSKEFMSHSNVDWDVDAHSRLVVWTEKSSPRLFTLSQGQLAIRFPKGFGIPVMSNEAFVLSNQVLNHNVADININVRHKVTFDYILDRDRKAPMKALFPKGAFVLVLLEGKDGYFNVDTPNETQKHASCLPGKDAGQGNVIYRDAFGRIFSGHWVVPVGRQEEHTLVLWIPYDTTVHFISVHVHPFCESLELRDLTTGRTVFKSRARPSTKGIGLEHVDYFSSEEGLPIYKDHQYELVSIYNNTSPVTQDAMATIGLYLLDKGFKRPERAAQR